jgi:sarcosine oxidase subunit alpha
LAPEDVAGVLGTRAVEGVRTREGRALPCGLVAVAAPPAPASELARQAGARVRWDGAGFAVAREESGRCGRFGRAQLWAAGDVCGWQDPALARTDGERVAREIVRSVRELGGGDD